MHKDENEDINSNRKKINDDQIEWLLKIDNLILDSEIDAYSGISGHYEDYDEKTKVKR